MDTQRKTPRTDAAKFTLAELERNLVTLSRRTEFVQAVHVRALEIETQELAEALEEALDCVVASEKFLQAEAGHEYDPELDEQLKPLYAALAAHKAKQPK